MHYRSFSTQDFIQDEFFQQWVFSPNEERDHYWTTFLLHYPSQQSKVDEARRFLLAMDFGRDVPESVLEDIRLGINAAIDKSESTVEPILRPVRKSRRRAILYSIAASLLVVTIALVGLLTRDEGTLPLFRKLAYEQTATPRGVQRHLILQDGTQVWLNAKSSLQYPETFTNSDTREVFLEGEAFFDVSEDKSKPFVVNTSGISIKVLGTAFNVRSYAGDPVVETTLVRGKVTITTDGEHASRSVTLRPNQKALFSKRSKVIALEEAANAETSADWRNGWMIFENKPFSYIKETLERWYNVTIEVEDERSLSCTFTAKFKDKSLQEVLEIFRNTESISYSIDGDHVIINGRLCDNEN